MWNLEGRTVYTTARGYRLVSLPEHPNARRGTIFLHRVVMENALGRLLLSGEVVHHDNEDKGDNSLANLVLTSGPEHARHHAAQRPKLGESMIALVCDACLRSFVREKRNAYKYERVYCSRACSVRTSKPRAIPCGSYGAYRKGCRCAECRGANAARQRRYQERKT